MMANNNSQSENEDIPLISKNAEDEGEKEEICREEDGEGSLENWQAYMHLFKAFVGVGILGLPSGVFHAGIVAGPILLFAIGISCLSGMVLLATTIKTVRERISVPHLTYGELTRELLSLHSDFLGRSSKILIDIIVCSMQLGFCCVYVMFLGTTLHKLIGSIRETLLMAAFLPLILGIALVRNIRKLSYLTSFANIVLLVTLLITMQYFVAHLKSPLPEAKSPNIISLMVGAGQILYGFEGIGLVPTLEKKMRDKNELPRLLGITLTLITLLYFSFGFLGYLCFGIDTAASVALNLPDEPLYSYLDIIYMVIVCLSYPVQFFVPVDVIVSHLEERLSAKSLKLAEYGVRAACVLLTFIIAITVPQLDNFMALIGSFTASIVTFVFPSLLHTLCFWNEGLSKWQLFFNILLFIFGIFSLIVGTFSSIVSIIERFENRA